MTTPSTLGPKAYEKSGACTGADSRASSGRSRKHRRSAGGVNSVPRKFQVRECIFRKYFDPISKTIMIITV